jgi:NAD(P)-dependent dehydrogenase (short-subunit alcohol dehydrogenase family)
MAADDPTDTAPANGDIKSEDDATLLLAAPQLLDPTHNISVADVHTAVRVLTAFGRLHNPKTKKPKDDGTDDDIIQRYRTDASLRPFRKALASCLELQKRTMYNGQDETAFWNQDHQARSLKRQKISEKALQQKYIATTQLRQGRIERLQQLKSDGKDEEETKLRAQQFLIPDGPVTVNPNNAAMIMEQESSNKDADDDTTHSTKHLPFHRSCYVCKTRYRQLHSFYDQLCPSCADLNWEKRHALADCTGKVAVLTGARVKIGYQTCLKLLRANCRMVVATTRFPNAAVANFQAEPDFESFRSRLMVYGLDLRDVTGLEAFTRYLKLQFSGGIDILINNACQTVRRPVQYYTPLVEQEQVLWKSANPAHKQVLGGCVEFERIRRMLDVNHRGHDGVAPAMEGEQQQQQQALLLNAMEEDDDSKPPSDVLVTAISSTTTTTTSSNHLPAAPFEMSGLSHSAVLSQTILLPEDAGVSDAVLPPGVTDINGHQVDLRNSNSWLLKMEEVSTPEVMECMFINCIAPFVLNSRLKPLMCTPDSDTRPDRYIINVSAMEGKFYRYKMPNHPHTNMAKAALNMLTRTSAEDLASKHRIYMNSVDTGWINDENPLHRAKQTETNNKFQTPIDEIDAAARILDPVFSGIRGEGKKQYGCFLKDYHESEW